ncbi:teneurin-m-like isoform X2 [Ornithodoros turicata]|uniref:teneurin-m-like isoform X2 n=1 Tax=Ornithodoros turicata TaxID=34597 RepID=UPI0031392039
MMDSLSKQAVQQQRVQRQGSRLRRQRSQEWQDPYSSSDNDDDPDFRHQYEDPRNVVDHRVIERGRGRSIKGPNSTSSLTHGSMELLTGPRGYGGGPGSGSDGEGYSQPPPKYPGYGSLPRNGGGVPKGAVVNSIARTGSRCRPSLRRGPSSSSTSDNNSDATYTDSELPLHRRGNGQTLTSQSRELTLRESPPEPAPPAVPPRNVHAIHGSDTLVGRSARLGYLESECESEPPYLPSVIGGPPSQYAAPGEVMTTNMNCSKAADAVSLSAERESKNTINRSNRNDNERVYCQPQNIIQTTEVPTEKEPCPDGSTYSNPLPVFCGTPCSTTGPMVPVPSSCVSPQLIQQQNTQGGPPGVHSNHGTGARSSLAATTAFASAAMATSRFHIQKACGGHRCSWKLATVVLSFVVIVLSATLAYFAAMSTLGIRPEGSKACIVVENGNNVQSMAAERVVPTVKGSTSLGPPKSCPIVPSEVDAYGEVKLGVNLTQYLQPHDTWNLWFNQPDPAFVRFKLTARQGSRLVLLARKNEPPSLTSRDFSEIVASEDSRRPYRRAAVLEEVDFIHYLEPGTWYLSVINDDATSTAVTFHPAVASDIPTSCPNNCHSHGRCHLGKCHCFPGYIGLDCADSVCPVLCSGHGRFVQGACRCEGGWKGAECGVSEDACEVQDCTGHGVCVKGVCQCHTGFKGEHCEQVDCPDPDCTGHGVCVDGQCWCKIGWRGPNCSQPDDRLSRCFPDCSAHGVFDLETQTCVCFDHWTGPDCSRAKCSLDCGPSGRCEEGRCRCEPGWTGQRCDQRECDPRCLKHGQCNNGTCVCIQGWMGTHCTLDGCPEGCNNNGQCTREGESWRCNCLPGWAGRDCSVAQETKCTDKIDNDEDGLVDCADSECCYRPECTENLLCLSSPEPQDILLRKQPPAVTASFYQKMKFLIEEESVQSYSHRDEYSESRVSVIRGRVTSKEGNGIIGIRVSVATDPQFGFTLTRNDGWFDILVNGGGAVTLQFQRNPFHPIKRTIMVPWNDIVVMGHVVMSVQQEEDQQSHGLFQEQEPCEAHDYERMKPIVYQTWRPGSQGGCTESSAILAETQVIQETLEVPGSELRLVYHSGHAQGYLSTIHLQLTPSTIPDSLRLVYLRIVVEGILFEKTFEADPDIKYTFAWNKRNVYKQKVYGLTTVTVFVGYEYGTCKRTVWTTQSTTLRGYDMDISELGGWNLDIHHRYNFHEGVLQQGDGSTVYFKHQPRVIQVPIGTGQQRPLLCPECNGLARDNKLLAPVALTSGPDGSVYVGDLNLVRRITPSGQVYTVYRMKTTDVSYQYHLTLSPTDGHLYISDPERHQILRVHSLDKVEDPDSNFDVVVGNGERCIPRDHDNCGDGRPALEAKLSYPKGMAVAVDNSLYFGDGNNIRVVDSRGIIHTLIGDHHHKRQWRPIPCSGTLHLSEVKLRWPTELAINPVDNSLYFIDDHMILKLTKDQRILVVAGQPVYCKAQQGSAQKSRMGDDADLGTLISFAFGPTGTMYIAEVDQKDSYRVRALTPDGELLHFAGRDESRCKQAMIAACDPGAHNCSVSSSLCAPTNGKTTLAVDTKLHSVSSLTVTSDDVVHIADLGSLKILSAIPYLPEPDDQQEYQIAHPENHELYVFNKYGQHIVTRSILTGKTKYTFLYNVNTSLGKLSAVTDTSGNKVAFLRDSGNSLHTIETARGQKCRVHVAKEKLLELLESFVNPDNLQTHFKYDPSGLLLTRYDATGKTFHYLYDENGRLTDVVNPSGRVTTLEFDLSSEGASVSAIEDNGKRVVTVRGTTVITAQGGVSIETTFHQDGSVEVSTPWKAAAVWEADTHRVLRELLPVQAGMFPVPVRQTLFWGVEPAHTLQWRYDLKFSRRENDRAISAVERVLLVNGTQYLTTEYDWVAAREILYNSSRRPFLVVQYDSFARPVQWLPTDTRVPLNVMYDRLGRFSGWQQGLLSESFVYDRLGHLSEVRLPDNAAVKYTYDTISKPTKVILPSGRTFAFHYDDNGGLLHVVTPKETRHSFLVLVSIGFYKVYYTPPGNSGPCVVHFNDLSLPILKIYPRDKGRVLYRYSQSLLTAVVFGGGKIETNYTSTGLVKSEAWSEDDVEVRHEYYYDGALLTQCVARFYSKFQLTTANFHYRYDKWFKVRSLSVRIGTLQFPETEFTYSPRTGRREVVGNFRFHDHSPNETVIADNVAKFTQQTDAQHRIHQRSLHIGDKEVYRMDVRYGNRDGVVQTRTLMRLTGGVQLRTQNFSYDEDDQLTEMMGKDHWKFSYDANGNIVTMQYMGNKIEILHDVGDRISRFGETPFVVDDRGFVVQRGEERFLYNTKGQLTKAYRTRRGKYEVRYFYDARNRLAMRKDHFGNMTQFFYADPAKPSLVTHVYNNADGRSMSLVYDANDFLIHILVNKDSFYVATDHNGSPTLVFDKYGEVIKEVYRGPYGHIIYDSTPLFYLPVDFQGGIFDPLTGLIHFGERIYDSLMGKWMTPQWEDVLHHATNVRKLHLYQFNQNDPVNLRRSGSSKKLDLSNWIENQGIDISSLGLGRPSILRDAPGLVISSAMSPTYNLPLPAVPLISGYACAVRRRLESFSRLSSVESSKVKREQSTENSIPKLSTINVPFGRGITVSRVGGRAVIRSVDKSDPIQRDVYTSVFNNSYLLSLHLVMHGQDVFYFVKDSTWRFHEDITQLQRLGTSINTTVHQSKADDGAQISDVRIHTPHAILNIRYGTVPEREKLRLLWHAKKHAVSQRWAQERQVLLTDQHGSSLGWSEKDKEHIIRTGSAPGYRGDYYHDVDSFPELSDDPSNIVFHKLQQHR